MVLSGATFADRENSVAILRRLPQQASLPLGPSPGAWGVDVDIQAQLFTLTLAKGFFIVSGRVQDFCCSSDVCFLFVLAPSFVL